MDITNLTKQAKAAKKAFKADKTSKDLKKAYKQAKKKLAEAEAAKVAAEAAAKAAAENKSDSSSDSEEESDSDEEEETAGPTLEELKAAMKAAKKAFKADKTNKDLKKAFKAAKKAVADKESGATAETTPSTKKRKRDAEEEEEAVPAKKAKEEPKEEATEDAPMKVVDNSKASSNPMANEKLFIGNLSFDIDDDGIKAFFKDCGEINDVFWLKDRDTDRFKGCGFVTFDTVDQACKAVEMNGQECMGREIRIDFAKPRPGGNKPKGKSREARPLSEKPAGCMTVFCGNLSFDIDDTKMQEFATSAGCGEIAHIRWLTDRDSGDFKGCGFIEFNDTADVDKFVLKNGADCMGRNIRCDYAKPRAPRD